MQLIVMLPGKYLATDDSRDSWYRRLSCGPAPNMPELPCTSTFTPSTPQPVPAHYDRISVLGAETSKSAAALCTRSARDKMSGMRVNGSAFKVAVHVPVKFGNVVHYPNACRAAAAAD